MQGLNDMDGAMQYMTAPGTSNGQGNNVEPSNGKPGKPNKDPRNGGNPPKPKEKRVKGMQGRYRYGLRSLLISRYGPTRCRSPLCHLDLPS